MHALTPYIEGCSASTHATVATSVISCTRWPPHRTSSGAQHAATSERNRDQVHVPPNMIRHAGLCGVARGVDDAGVGFDPVLSATRLLAGLGATGLLKLVGVRPL